MAHHIYPSCLLYATILFLIPHFGPTYTQTEAYHIIPATHRTGFGQHGDYVFGWKGDALQKAMDSTCFGATCNVLKSQAFTEANKCAVQNSVSESVEGCKFPLALSHPDKLNPSHFVS